jgi:hypothetical protein
MKKIILLIFLIFAIKTSQACDVCGCSLGGNYFGLLPSYNKHFIGIRWSQAKFHAFMNHDSEYFENEYSNDTYRKMEMWGRWRINDRWQLFAFVPYSYNDMNGSHQRVSTKGLSDISVVITYKMFASSDSSSSDWKHMMTVGGGAKIPTGKFDLEDQGKLVNPNFQLGTGSVDFLLNAVYTLRYRRVGINIESAYKVNTKNQHDYRFGNQFNVSTQLFYMHTFGKISVLPNAGLYLEHARKHHQGNAEITNTGGRATFFSSGVETYFSNFSLGVNYKKPIKQRYNSDDVADITAKARWSVTMTYSF